jgi:hypothetical protein
VTEIPLLHYRYQFTFDNNHTITFEINLDPETLEYVSSSDQEPAEWTRLDYLPCEQCSLMKSSESVFCPIAVNIATIVEAFKDTYSYDTVDVRVESKERVYSRKQISIQQALSSILGIIMVSSGCEDLDKLRPMVRYHLPFASIEETIYRAASMYLLGQYFRRKHGLEPDWDMKQLINIYQKIDRINVKLVKRLQAATSKDASLNAVVVLDVFAQMLPMSIEETLTNFESFFSCYLK